MLKIPLRFFSFILLFLISINLLGNQIAPNIDPNENGPADIVYEGGGSGGGAGNIKSLDHKYMGNLLFSPQSVLRHNLKSYIQTMDLNHFSQMMTEKSVQDFFSQESSRNEFIDDVLNSPFREGDDKSPCYDRNADPQKRKRVAISTEFKRKANICIDVTLLYNELKNSLSEGFSAENIIIHLAAILAHENYHHFQTDPQQNQNLIQISEKEANDIGAYILSHAKFKTIQYFIWDLHEPKIISEDDVCSQTQKQLQKYNIELQSAKEVKKMYSQLSADALGTHLFSLGLMGASLTILLKKAYAPSNLLENAEIFTKGFLLTTLTYAGIAIKYSLFDDEHNQLNQDRANQLEKIKHLDTILSLDTQIEVYKKSRSSIDLNWSKIENALSLGGVAAYKTKALFDLSVQIQKFHEKKIQSTVNYRTYIQCTNN